MKSFEATLEQLIPPGMYMIVRLQGVGLIFKHDLNDAMIETTEHLMTCGFNVTYAHTGNDEISLLFDINENSHRRKVQKFVSIVAAEASAKLTNVLGKMATFECRLLTFPNKPLVRDYFRLISTHNKTYSVWSCWKVNDAGSREIMNVPDKEIVTDILD